MGHADILSRGLFDGPAGPESPQQCRSPEDRRKEMVGRSPAERAEYARTVSVGVDAYRLATRHIDILLDRAKRTKCPGGLWILGDGGLGKTFILSSAYQRHAPTEGETSKNNPLMTLTFDGYPSVSEILLKLILQLGQDPDSLRYQNNADLEAVVLDALPACGVLGILFDEAHHLWLNTRAKRVADRVGGRLGDFMKRFYDKSGVAFVFAGTPGLQTLLDADKQARTRWKGCLVLEQFSYDDRFVGLLAALDEALPMPRQGGFASKAFAEPLFQATQGNFRDLKDLLSEAVFIAASASSPCVTGEHLAQAYRQTFCAELTPFDKR